uniref:Uncharacterized protein n=1 Tax=Glossina palpalis gambiensis TaxID=67801 RepID=A0A1B0B3Y4_9MUSC
MVDILAVSNVFAYIHTYMCIQYDTVYFLAIMMMIMVLVLVLVRKSVLVAQPVQCNVKHLVRSSKPGRRAALSLSISDFINRFAPQRNMSEKRCSTHLEMTLRMSAEIILY